MVRIIYISIFLLTWNTIVIAQSVSESPAKLKTIFEKYHQLNLDIPGNKVYYVDYNINAKLRSETNEAKDQRVRSWMSKERQVVRNEYVEMYSNQDYTVTILLQEKRVNITSLPKGYAQQGKTHLAFSLIDRLFEKYHVSSCILISDGIYKIILFPGKGGVEDFNVEKAEILIDWKDEKLKGFTTIMANGEIQSMTMTVNKLDFDHKDHSQLIDFEKKYIETNGNLKGKYAGFKLFDNRNRKS